MFTWKGALNRAAYARRCATVVGLLVGTVLLFPFLLQWLVTASRCGMDTCGALALVASTAIRPILFAATFAMGLSACIRRSRDAGLRPWMGAFPLLMLVADQGFLQYAGSGWAYPFSAGILSIRAPVYALFGVILMGLLAVPARNALRGGESRALDRTLGVLGAWLVIGAGMRVADLWVLTALPSFIALLLFRLSEYAPYGMPLFLLLAAYRVWRARAFDPATPEPSPAAAAETANLWQPKRAAMIGAAIAFALLLWSLFVTSKLPFPAVLIALVAWLLPFFVPSFLMYTAVAAAALRLKAKPDAIAAAALLAALIPFGLWAASLSSVLMAKARERAAIAAIPKGTLPAKIAAVVIEGEDWSLINCARGFLLSGSYDVGDVLTRGQSKSAFLRFTRKTADRPVRDGVGVDSAPTDYVLIRFPRRPGLAAYDRVSMDITSPPVEIYAVDPSGERLVAATYTALNPPPAFPPMLTMYGWYRGDNSSTPEISCQSTHPFIERELLRKLPPAGT